MKHLPRIEYKTIPHKSHRYETVGDYWRDRRGVSQFRCSRMNRDFEFWVLIHELVEWYLTERAGISEPKQIKPFDEQYERDRERGLHGPDAEPGHDPRAPYHRQHVFAEKVEQSIIKHLYGKRWCKVWVRYGKTVMGL